MATDQLREVLRVGGVLGLVLFLSFPVITRVVKDSKTMPRASRMRLYVIVLYVSFCSILICAGAWAFSKWSERPPSKDCSVAGNNSTAGDNSPISNCNSGVQNYTGDSSDNQESKPKEAKK